MPTVSCQFWFTRYVGNGVSKIHLLRGGLKITSFLRSRERRRGRGRRRRRRRERGRGIRRRRRRERGRGRGRRRRRRRRERWKQRATREEVTSSSSIDILCEAGFPAQAGWWGRCEGSWLKAQRMEGNTPVVI